MSNADGMVDVAVFQTIGREIQEANLRASEEQFKKPLVLVAERPSSGRGDLEYGDWVPVVEMRRIIENGRTVRVQLAIRGEEGRAARNYSSGRIVTLEMYVDGKDWDIKTVVKEC